MDPKVDVTQIAVKLHEAMSRTTEALGQSGYTAWDDAEAWMRLASISTVQRVIEDPNMSAGICWRTWVQDKFEAGWRYGEKKDGQAKTHPLLPADGQSWDEKFKSLPWAEKLKDYVALGVITDELNQRRHHS